MAGVKEIKEVIDGSAALVVAVAKKLKDGFQASDVSELISEVLKGDSELKAKLQAAIDGIGQVPAEAADISILEGLSLGSHVLGKIKEVGESLK